MFLVCVDLDNNSFNNKNKNSNLEINNVNEFFEEKDSNYYFEINDYFESSDSSLDFEDNFEDNKDIFKFIDDTNLDFQKKK